MLSVWNPKRFTVLYPQNVLYDVITKAGVSVTHNKSFFGGACCLTWIFPGWEFLMKIRIQLHYGKFRPIVLIAGWHQDASASAALILTWNGFSFFIKLISVPHIYGNKIFSNSFTLKGWFKTDNNKRWNWFTVLHTLILLVASCDVGFCLYVNTIEKICLWCHQLRQRSKDAIVILRQSSHHLRERLNGSVSWHAVEPHEDPGGDWRNPRNRHCVFYLNGSIQWSSMRWRWLHLWSEPQKWWIRCRKLRHCRTQSVNHKVIIE